MTDYYDPDGRPMTLEEWSVAFSTRPRFRQTYVGYGQGKKFVSTVWLGLDHNFAGGPPLIFESMVFHKWTRDELDCRRYSTKAEAFAGHADLVRHWRHNRRQRRNYMSRKRQS